MSTPANAGDDAQRRVGTTIASKYRVESLLGTGGMGAVYLVTHLGVERKFALKLLHGDVAAAQGADTRFEREARAAGRIGHPNIVDIFDLGKTEDGALYMVMELLAGESLADRVARGRLPVAEAVQIGVEVLRALSAAHAAGIVHRDIKPANLFLVDKPDGSHAVKVLDFGIAKFASADAALTSTGAVVGSPLYMAPEQVRAEREIDGRVDLWAVGAVLYELLIGEAPHAAPTHAAVIARIVTKPVLSMRPLRPEIDPSLDDVVLRALAIDPEARYRTADDMRAALEGYGLCSAETVTAFVPTPHAPLAPAAPRSSLGVYTAIGLAAGVAIAFAIRSGHVKPADPQEPAPTSSTALSHTASSGSTPALASAPLPPVVSAPPAVSKAPAASTKAPASARHDPVPAHSAAPAASVDVTPCGAGEQLSVGHCCRIGLVWLGDRCDRPLATLPD